MLINVLKGTPDLDYITNIEAPMLAAAYACDMENVETLGAKLALMQPREHLVVNSHGANGTLARSGGRRFTADQFYEHLSRRILWRCGEVHLYACQTGLDGDPFKTFGGRLALLLANHFRRPIVVWAPRGNSLYRSDEKRYRIKHAVSGDFYAYELGWHQYICLWPGKKFLAVGRGVPQAPVPSAFDEDPYGMSSNADEGDVDWSKFIVLEEG